MPDMSRISVMILSGLSGFGGALSGGHRTAWSCEDRVVVVMVVMGRAPLSRFVRERLWAARQAGVPLERAGVHYVDKAAPTVS